MARSNEPAESAADGFEGAIAGLGLSDIIQLNVQNRFSGCIEVHYEDKRGLIFMKDGEIVHAEQGSISGEPAFYDILAWPGGRFVLQEKVATTRSSIRKSCNFLILEAHRLIDERRAGRGAPPPPPAKPGSAAALVERLRQILGVTYALLQGKDGARVGDDSYEAEVLSGQAIYLSMVGQRLGAHLGTGELVSAVVEGEARHLLFFVAKNLVLTVLADPAAQVGAVEAEVRKALAPAR
jgi:predicted regulator of Ras-like GTPase activity (Roadblock/LC7/MglB family)